MWAWLLIAAAIFWVIANQQDRQNETQAMKELRWMEQKEKQKRKQERHDQRTTVVRRWASKAADWFLIAGLIATVLSFLD